MDKHVPKEKVLHSPKYKLKKILTKREIKSIFTHKV